MIATVKIAPVEKWCELAKANSGHDLAGRPVRIITESLFRCECDGNAWMEPYEDSLKRAEEVGDTDVFHGTHYFVCEHMLEMD